MYLQLMNMAVCRTPVFSPDDAPEKCFPALKEMISEASPEFYQIIENLDHQQLNATGEKVAFSVWKYFNRAKYRATPFGSFAGISHVPVEISEQPLVLGTNLIKHTFTDWSEKDSYIDQKTPQWFQTNTTCYQVSEEIRYIRFTNAQFELATVPVIPELTALLQLCLHKTNRADIHKAMGRQFDISALIIDDLVAQMLHNQLLFSELSPNITGQDYFERLNINDKKKGYIIAERKYCSGSLDPSPLGLMPEYLNFIRDFLPQITNENLKKFQSSFSRRFDLKAVPLALAIDPETGVGYGGLATEPHEQELADIFGNKQQADNNVPVFSYTEQRQFLLNSLIKGGIIHLEDFKGKLNKNTLAVPNTFSTIFSYWNGMPVIENSGGCTANALLGRFTITGGQSYEMAKQIAIVEEQANSDTLFFDVAYQAEKQVDNVNRRLQLYENELPLLSWSCYDEPLSLDDLSVMIRNGEIILWSKKYQKRVIPRIASAYNYTRSDLAVYRFLCDMQHQQLSSDLTFRFRQMMPGLDHYPRVLYKNIIVSPAMWKLYLQKLDMHTLKEWLNKNQINSHFKCGNADQTLCFDPGNDEDLNAFLIFCRQKKDQEIYITEALLGDTIADPEGKRYIPQYITTFYHTEQVYQRCSPPVSAGNDIFQPGSEWLYTEIYCHPLRSNQVLQVIRKFTVKHKKLLKKWFFIRYTNPAPHLRLRLHLKDALNAGLLMSELRAELAGLSAAGLISDIQIKTYVRESERYGADRMPLVEAQFYKDSVYIAALLSRRRSNEELYILTLKLMYRWLILADIKDAVSFVKTIADNFSEEFSADKETYKQINRSFELIKKHLETDGLLINKSYEASFMEVVQDCKDESEKQSMLADLIHMHVNRVFYNGQRMHEAMLYQYLLKWLKAKRFREATEPAQ